jgi:hypothetical protein
MASELKLAGIILIQRKLDKNLPFKCIYKGSNQIWLITSKVL